MMTCGLRWIAMGVVLGASCVGAIAQTPQYPNYPSETPATFVAPTLGMDYERREVMIAMRDGVKLHTVILVPKGAKHEGILLTRTPYSANILTTNSYSVHLGTALWGYDNATETIVAGGYIRVVQDIRGKYGSEGNYVMNRPLHGVLNPTPVDESTDTYDTIDWLVKNTPESNGKVGVVGSSYLGFTTLMAEINPHPALKAAVPQSPMVDTWMGDDDFHNGAFRNNDLDYVVEMSTRKGEDSPSAAVGVGDDYTRWLEAGSTADYARQWGIEQYPFIQKMFQHPAYTDFWSLQAVDRWMAARPLTVPTLLVVGQWDQEDSYGGPAVYKALKDKYNDLVSLAIGPWRHSGVNHYGYDLGAVTFTGDTADEFRVKYMKPFFDHYLKGAPDPHMPRALTYATGVNRWEESPRWPMGTPTPLYLGDGFTAGFNPPARSGHDDYLSDPRKPVPFIPRPISMRDENQWRPWLVQDQRFVSDRPDVLVYQTTALDKPVHIMGAPQVDLFAATSGTDSDWVVKLIDVYPNTSPEGSAQGSKPGMAGYELALGIEIFRGRYVHSLDKPKALTPGKVEEYKFGLPNVDHVFLPGHKLMVQVQSSLFPLYDRNPQTFVENIFYARPGDYKTATQSVYYGAKTASSVLLPVVQ